MQPILQSLRPRLASDKPLDSLQFFVTARLKSAGVVENISIVIRKYEFILNIVMATLSTEASLSAIADQNLGIQPLLWR